MASRTLHPPMLAAALLLVLAACTPAAPNSPAASPNQSSPSSSASPAPGASASAAAVFPVELTDDAGRSITINEAPDRIVSLAPSNTEIVCALGACDRLVGVTDFDDYPASVSDVPDVVISAQVDVERVVDAEPDLILAAGNEITPSTVLDQLDELGLPVLVLYPESLDEVYDDIGLIGAALGVSVAADSQVDAMRSRVDELVAMVAEADRPRTLYEVFYSEGATYTAGEGSFLASLIEMAGGDPVTGDAQGLIGAEELVAADPELVLLGTASYDPSLADPTDALAAVRARPGWADLTAVVEGQVVPFLDDIVTTRPGPRIVDGLEALSRAIHPESWH